MSGPLHGLKVIELAGIGPAPFATMLLADLGADVVRIERADGADNPFDIDPKLALNNRGKQIVRLDLKHADGLRQAMELVARADVLVEGFRPGVAERLGLGPRDCHARNARLVYGRITGWGQEGTLSPVAGHDLNYIALSGALDAIGPRDKPAIPLNLLGDFGGGTMYLLLGILAALHERGTSGRGQVVDAAMVDGVASLMTSHFAYKAAGGLQPQRESNLLDGGAPFYALYQTADGLWVSVAALEPKFFANLVDAIGLDPSFKMRQYQREAWPAMREALATCLASRTRAQWCELLELRDACFAPVLSINEAPSHPHHAGRGTYVQVDGVAQPNVAPRFDRTPPDAPRPVQPTPVAAAQVLGRWRGA